MNQDLYNKPQNPFTFDLAKQSFENFDNQNKIEYAKLWRNDEMKNFLIDKIKDQKLRGEIDLEKKITEKMIITEYWRYWMSLPQKEKLKLIYTYPSLTKDDMQKLNNIVQEEKSKQFYWATGCTGVTLGCYKLFWAKKKRFYNFYRRPAPIIFGRPLFGYKASKVIFSVLFLEVFWIVSTNYFFNKSIPVKISKSGILDKYGVDIEEQNY